VEEGVGVGTEVGMGVWFDDGVGVGGCEGVPEFAGFVAVGTGSEGENVGVAVGVGGFWFIVVSELAKK
jgi:hypothetical protein